MTTFSYTTGNPSNLTAAANASMNDIQGPFTDLRTFLNGGNLDETTNVPNLAAAFTTYKTHVERATAAPATTVDAAATYALMDAGSAPFKVTNGNSYGGIFYFDPADWTANSRSTKLRLRVAMVTNAFATAVTTTVGLYPSSGVSSGTISAGTVVSGSTVAFASPAINSQNQSNSGDFTAPIAGFYFLGFATTGNYAASSGATIAAQLQVRQT